MTYELPEDLGALSAEELDAHISDATEAFRALRNDENLTDADLDTLAGIGESVAALKGEATNREALAVAAQERLKALSAEVLGEEGTEETEEESEAVEEVAEVEAAAVVTPPARGMVRLNSVKSNTAPAPAVTASAELTASMYNGKLPEITAAGDIPGHRAGARMELGDLVPGFIARAQALQSQGGGTGLVASYHHPFSSDLTVSDLGNADEGSKVSEYAASQRRLPGKDLVAAGGWCSPSETMYNFLNVSCPDMLWDAPEISLSRGGLRFFPTPVLDVAAMTFLHTEAADIAGTPKPCYTIPCPDPTEVRCDAVGVCVRAGLLTQRHFPELITSQIALTAVAHEIRLRQVLLNQLAAAATPVTILASFGALSAVYSAVALQAADIIERFSLCDNIALEVVFPWWSRNMFLADVARRNGVSVEDVTTADVQAVFTPLGVRIQWARGIKDIPFPQDNDETNNEIGGTTPATVWPANVQFIIYPTGQVQIGRGAEVNLGVVYDHASLQLNNYTALFQEECVALVNRAPAGSLRIVTVPVCPSGTTGGQVVQACPVG